MRLFLIEHAGAQTNSNVIHVAVVAVDGGLRVVVRVSAMEDSERLRLRDAIAGMLRSHGISEIDIVIQTASPAEAGARQE